MQQQAEAGMIVATLCIVIGAVFLTIGMGFVLPVFMASFLIVVAHRSSSVLLIFPVLMDATLIFLSNAAYVLYLFAVSMALILIFFAHASSLLLFFFPVLMALVLVSASLIPPILVSFT